jgi:hypothetical protein
MPLLGVLLPEGPQISSTVANKTASESTDMATMFFSLLKMYRI